MANVTWTSTSTCVVPAWTGVESWDPAAGAAAAKGIGLGALGRIVAPVVPPIHHLFRSESGKRDPQPRTRGS